ncbi:MAG: bifunctional diaminohydroxyphosphoribosylaminopyrimidine deaminase/5-amino-6-(5-phosphoribosylamino)uracil reductase RibD [Alphaproteobacteria bacterium]|nr:bifunctional diaminohydroxyphosphoribosylaminopyrimidine deaminase/5-amino-6-(5-phosphoribosylamino)uracil reductase RibD [Alphaproteobacteria bacterium]
MVSSETLSAAMKQACAEARRWLGATSPNPSVGAVGLDADGNVLGVTAHQRTGGMHAEVALIEHCREQGTLDRLHTMCVTMTPCNHHGRTPPCCDFIIDAKIRRVVIGTLDPNPAVKGGSIKRLCKAGVEVVAGVEEEMCRQLIYAFAVSVKTRRPWITVKRALDEHGSMIPPVGRKTFTSESSLRMAHQLRKRADAILTGSGTILADFPLFTVRNVPDYPEKKRFLAIMDRRKRVPPVWLDEARARGLEPIVYDNLHVALNDLAARGVRETLVEAGPLVSEAILNEGLWNMDVVIKKGETDKIEVQFNPQAEVPFHVQEWLWENVLPA